MNKANEVRLAVALTRTAVAGLVLVHIAGCDPSKPGADSNKAKASTKADAKVEPPAKAAAADQAESKAAEPKPAAGAGAPDPAKPATASHKASRAPAGAVAKCGADFVERIRDIRKDGEDGPFKDKRKQAHGVAQSLKTWDQAMQAPPALTRDELADVGGRKDGSVQAGDQDVEYTFDAAGLPLSARVFSAGSEEHAEEVWTYVRECTKPSPGAVMQLMSESVVELELEPRGQTLGKKFGGVVDPHDKLPEVTCDPAAGGGWACRTTAGGMIYSVTVVEADKAWVKIKPGTVDVIDDD